MKSLMLSFQYPTIKLPAIMLRILLAAALILPLITHYADTIVLALMPLYRDIFEFLGNDYNVIFFGLTVRGMESVIRVDVNLAHALELGGHLVWPDPRGAAHVITPVAQVVQPIAVALIAVMGWPCPSLRRRLFRLVSVFIFLLFITLADVPFFLAGEVKGMLIDNISPGTRSALIIWDQFLMGGGRLVLGIFAALASLSIESLLTNSASSNP